MPRTYRVCIQIPESEGSKETQAAVEPEDIPVHSHNHASVPHQDAADIIVLYEVLFEPPFDPQSDSSFTAVAAENFLASAPTNRLPLGAAVCRESERNQ